MKLALALCAGFLFVVLVEADRGATPPKPAQKKPPPTEDGKCCIPNQTYKEDCNVCLCAADGIGATCTLRACVGDNWESRRKQPDGE
ncbi:serine protease inhibitor I/II-like [Schistocerca serialis cubense]|uniref:serine protease inhibitor I/II-like n=1 Tax=Schistocerca serialis cubense TaxID=2023355 RepID=UPI00214EF3BD|nr:serine protease inhibitor I/II-like [Schistocerca serialis cubense]